MAKFGEGLSDADRAQSAALQTEYRNLCHAMQSGVAASMGLVGDHATEPKHLRVGINSAMVEHSAIVLLLVDKGIISEVEYFTALRDIMKREVEKYESQLSSVTGKKVTLI